MAKKTGCATLLLLAAMTVVEVVHGAEAPPAPWPTTTDAIPADPAQLKELVAALDRKMFDAYNAHDLDGVMAMFAEDLEFYHDTGGLLGFEQVRAGFASVFASNKDIRRDLVPGSLEVYPIKGYGAIQTGMHTFCHTENGRPDCGTFKFTQIWRLKDGEWKVPREVSYGH
jgi:ketosteroid isomerase-like protein